MDSLVSPPPNGDIHPRNKTYIGKRLAHAALGLIYKQHRLSITGPLIKSCRVYQDKVELYLKEESLTNEDLVLKSKYGFEVFDKVKSSWVALNTSEVSKNTITINLNDSGISQISNVRYLWAANPCCPLAYQKGEVKCPNAVCGLYTSKSDLPMPPFIYEIVNSECVVPQ